jgi:hypothetical protein
VPAQNGALNVRDNGVVKAINAREYDRFLLNFLQKVVAQLVFHRSRLVTAFFQFAKRAEAGQVFHGGKTLILEEGLKYTKTQRRKGMKAQRRKGTKTQRQTLTAKLLNNEV